MNPLMILLSTTDSTDQAFLTDLYLEYSRLMFKTASRYTSNFHDKEEIVQIALLNAVKSVEKIRKLPCCDLPAYLVILTRNSAINYLKHNGVISRHTVDLEENYTNMPSPTALSLDDLAILNDQRNLLSKIWPKLSESDQILLAGRYMIGYSNHELAEILGCKPDSIRMKLTRARRRALEEIERIGGCYDESGTTAGKIGG